MREQVTGLRQLPNVYVLRLGKIRSVAGTVVTPRGRTVVDGATVVAETTGAAGANRGSRQPAQASRRHQSSSSKERRLGPTSGPGVL
jgi:hypothetical protein